MYFKRCRPMTVFNHVLVTEAALFYGMLILRMEILWLELNSGIGQIHDKNNVVKKDEITDVLYIRDN
jgi:hypothetical protein